MSRRKHKGENYTRRLPRHKKKECPSHLVGAMNGASDANLHSRIEVREGVERKDRTPSFPTEKSPETLALRLHWRAQSGGSGKEEVKEPQIKKDGSFKHWVKTREVSERGAQPRSR